MAQVKDYYQKLEPVFKLYLKNNEIPRGSGRIVRAEFLGNFYHRIEKRLNQLREEVASVLDDKPSVGAFKLQVQRYFLEEYFHNSNFFLSLLFEENLSVFRLLKEQAN